MSPVKPRVCILTAGRGTRMGQMGEVLNKSLFPVDQKAAISWIIESFDDTTEFVIALGYLGDQVQDYLRIAHPSTKFKFVFVDKIEGIGSGPGYSLLKCKNFIDGPFYFVSCDTLWTRAPIENYNENWIAVAQVTNDESNKFCNVRVKNQVVNEIRDKESVDSKDFFAFTGLCFIKDHKYFWEGLGNNKTVINEHQVSNGLAELCKKVNVKAVPIDWMDIGTAASYQAVAGKFQNFDFGKTNECLYLNNEAAIKFFSNNEITRMRVEKARLRPEIFPKISRHANQFYAYEFVKGQTLYEQNSSVILNELLDWLFEIVWTAQSIDLDTFRKRCFQFYKEKTLGRLKIYDEKYQAQQPMMINGKKIPDVKDLMKSLDWQQLSDGYPAFIHGDLQFDNILYNEDTRCFTLLDWRQDFAGDVQVGDLYYDLGKLYGGIILNYDLVKMNLMRFWQNKSIAEFDFGTRFSTKTYIQILENFIKEKGFDLIKVRTLVGLIYLNMAPLHHYPFDRILHALGRQTVYYAIEGKEII